MAMLGAATVPRRIRGPLSRESKKTSNLVFILLISGFLMVFVGVVLYLQILQSMDQHQGATKGVQSPLKAVPDSFPESMKQQTLRKAPEDVTVTVKSLSDVVETLVLKTEIGDIRIVLRPDLSKESIDYIHAILQQGCRRCNLYRAEKPGILQGMITNKEVPLPTVRGSCPPGSENVRNECPEWDKQCACHGPVMAKGMVAWAAGETGPDFFIDAYKAPANWWGTQHTVWGKIQDDASFDVIEQIWTMPVVQENEMTYIKSPLQFKMELQTTSRR